MKPATWITAATLLALAAAGYYLYQERNNTTYIAAIEAHRNEKDIYLGSDPDSPFLHTNTPFRRLRYFPPNPAYRIRARLVPPARPDSLTLATSTGEPRTYRVFGTAEFELHGTPCRLLVFYTGPGQNLFIPFADATSGHTTYGGGRYLEASLPDDDILILDFNLAYNPYCAYVDTYSCPFPPKANRLPVPVEAGEKNYH